MVQSSNSEEVMQHADVVAEMNGLVGGVLDGIFDPVTYVEALCQHRIWVNATIEAAQEDIRLGRGWAGRNDGTGVADADR